MPAVYFFFACDGAVVLRLNIFNIRSVITNPPTTLIVEQVTATNPRIVLTAVWCAPAVTNDPTRDIPEIALVADMSGVCNRGGTREITWYPRKAARRITYRVAMSVSGCIKR
jgi:hypothetical protein